MIDISAQKYLLKFYVVSAGSFFIGTLHGTLQVLPPIRKWLDSIGSPLTNPGHMIDPLAHAHINLIGGLCVFSMGTVYLVLSLWNEGKLFSRLLANLSFWFTTCGVLGFYSLHLLFGIWEGNLLLQGLSEQRDLLHKQYYGISISIVATIMALGFFVYAINVFMTSLRIYRR